MPTKGTPAAKVRVDPEVWAEYETACKTLGLGDRSAELRRHIEEVIDRYRKTVKKSA